MAYEDLQDRKYVATNPVDSTDTPKFGQIKETAKDVFQQELSNFFSYQSNDVNNKIMEYPTIQKFAEGGDEPLETFVNRIMSYADTSDRFPMIAITATSVREKKMGLGSNFVQSVEYTPTVVSSNVGPFTFEDGWEITFNTYPNGDLSGDPVESTITFLASDYNGSTTVSAEDIATRINNTQALYYQLSATSAGALRISAGGPAAWFKPNSIEITGGDATLLTRLGFTIGDSQSYLEVIPANRYSVAADMTINIDVVADSTNTRTELADLVFDFFAGYMEKRFFQFLGRSYFDRDLDPEEWFHIVLNNQFSWSGEINTPRQGGEQYDYIYAVRGVVPIFIEDFVDRKIASGLQRLIPGNVSYDDTMVDGDYFKGNYRK